MNVTLKRQSRTRLLASLVILIIGATSISLMAGATSARSTATLVFPRLGVSMRGPPTFGPGFNTTAYLSEKVTFWVAPEPSESPIPQEWLDPQNWDVALVPSVIPTANCTPLKVERVVLGNNDLALFGGGLDVNPVFPTAVGIECSVPADIPPLVYNLAIGFKITINPATQASGDVNLIPRVGSWRAESGSAMPVALGGAPQFLLTEASAIAFPWIHDALTSDGSKLYNGTFQVKPFQVMHVTDTHYDTRPGNVAWLENNEKWENDSQVVAPDVIIISGDLMEGPQDGFAEQYELAYEHLVSLHAPLVVVSGNHDNKNIGPWRHYFGPLFSSTRFDDLTIVGVDSTLPFGTTVLSWIDEHTRPVKPGAPVFITQHYNLDPTYFASGWIGVGSVMEKNNVTAILVGHTHGDLVGGVEAIKNAILKNVDVLLNGGEEEFQRLLDSVLETSNDTTGYLQPVSEPQVFMTRTAGKTGYVIPDIKNINTSEPYSGFRLITIQDNKVLNYTYDLDGDGTRDPIVSTPSGTLLVSWSKDPGLGIDPNATITWTLNNTGNEPLVGARAQFLLPRAPAGYKWNLIPANRTFAYLRASVSNSTHSWFDARVPAPPRSVVRLQMYLEVENP